MPCVTCAKWDRTLILNIPIFIAIWIGLCAALEIHLCLIIRHNIEGYQLNTYRLEVSGYLDNPWWRELYINLEFSRLCFGSCPIGPFNDDEAPPHADWGDHVPTLEGRPPTPPRQSDPSGSNQTILVSTGGNIPQLAEPPRYYNSQWAAGGRPRWGTASWWPGAVDRCLAIIGPGSRRNLHPTSWRLNAGPSNSFPMEWEWSS